MLRKKSELLKEEYFQTVHSSGLSIYVFPKKLTTTYAVFSTKYGSVDDEFRLAGEKEWIKVPDGVAHFLEHKMFENPDGSDSFAKFSAYGADANAYTTYTRTAYLFSCTEGFEGSLEELLRFVTTPYFTPATVKKEQGIIGEEIRMYEDNPWERCYENLLKNLYEKNPIRKNICGSEKSISQITDKLLYDCHKVFYRPSNMVLVVCGNVTPESVMNVVDRVLTGTTYDQREIERKPVEEPEKIYREYSEERMKVGKPIFSIGIKDPEIPKDPVAQVRKDIVMSILDEILFSASSKFYNDLYEKDLLSPGFSAGYSITDRCAFHGLFGESNEPETVLSYLKEYLLDVSKKGIDKEDFERCKRVLYADEICRYDSTEEIANHFLNFVFDGVDPFLYPEIIREVTKEEVEKAMQNAFPPEYFSMAVIKPLEEEKGAK